MYTKPSHHLLSAVTVEISSPRKLLGGLKSAVEGDWSHWIALSKSRKILVPIKIKNTLQKPNT